MSAIDAAFLKDFVREVLELANDQQLYVPGDAYGAGYRAALYSVIHILEQQVDAWDLTSNDVGLGNFSADEWRKVGLPYVDKGRWA